MCVDMSMFLCTDLFVILEGLAWSSDTEKDAVRVSKLLVGSPLVASSETSTRTKWWPTSKTQPWNKRMMITTNINSWTCGWRGPTHGEHAPEDEIIKSAAVCCTFITGFCKSHPICAAEEGHEIKCVDHCLVHLKQIQAITTFFLLWFRFTSNQLL